MAQTIEDPGMSERHYSEADLLETYYVQPGASMPVMMHLADCTDCAARYEKLEKKVRGLAACGHDEKPDTFWARQRIAVMRKLPRDAAATRATRIAAAALLVATLGGWMTWRSNEQPVIATAPVVASEEITVQVTSSTDPWDSEELDEYGSLVAWESWEDPS